LDTIGWAWTVGLLLDLLGNVVQTAKSKGKNKRKEV